MPEEITDSEREELRHEKNNKKKQMTMDEILKCPTWDCDGGPEVWSAGRVPGGTLWKVGCPKCKGWMSQFLIPDGSDVDPYMKGVDIWIEMRKELGH